MMEVLEHADAGGSGLQFGDSRTEGLGATLGGLRREAMDGGPAGPLQVFHPGDSAEEQRSAILVADSLRCQVKITTQRSLHLRIANHTARDVYVRLVGHGKRIATISPGPQEPPLQQSVAPVKDSVPVSPHITSAALKDADQPAGDGAPTAPITDPACMEPSHLRPQTPKTHQENKEDESSGALTISELSYSPCASMLPSPVEDSQGGLELLFSSPVQSPARLLRELHADPEIQAKLEAERERDRAYERTRLAARGGVGGVLSSGLRLLSSNQRVNACVLGAARLVAVVMGVLFVTVPTLLLLLESDIDVSFLHEIRQTPEFEQFHYEYYCPLRRWVLCKLSMALENLWSD